jgi:DNA topoisomerase-2
MVVNEELELRKKKKDALLKELQKLKFTPMSELNAIMKGKDNRRHKGDKKEEEAEEDAGNEEAEADKSDYDYLLGMNLWSLTFEKVEEIKKQLKAKEEELKLMQKKTIETFWDEDLQALSVTLDELDAAEEADAAAAQVYAEGRRKKVGARAPKAPIVAAARKRINYESKFFSQPLVSNAGGDLQVAKSVSGQGEGGPTRYSAADIPLEDQQRVARDPDVIQRPAKVPRRRAPDESATQAQDLEAQPADSASSGGSGASLLQRMLANRKVSIPEPTTSSGHGSLSTGSDFFFGSSSSIFSSGLPQPSSSSDKLEAADEDAETTKSGGRGSGRGRGRGAKSSDEPAKKVAKKEEESFDVD